jgi:glutaminyl-peptide cyclotransferase
MKKMVLSGLKKIKLLSFILTCSIFLNGCQNDTKNKTSDISVSEKSPAKEIAVPEFNADSAFHEVKKQVDFGPRTPDSKAHTLCAAYFINKLKQYADTVLVQRANIPVFDGKTFQIQNIMAQFHPHLKNRILLCAHWDTRPWADQDIVNQKEPIDGANDGGSGVGILIEMARQMHLAAPTIGVDILLLDLEDYGQPSNSTFPRQEDTYALGTQYWSKNIPIPGYHADFGVLLDMVGAPKATFGMEEYSRQFAPTVVKKIWDAAASLGYGEFFIYKETGAITDDHYYINNLAKIPTIDIIHHDPLSNTGFGTYWHTHNDNLKAVDKNTLKAVGQTLLSVIYNERL